jgi:2,5-dihydroxypyridine 5,6-dioxygenase
VLDLTLEGLLHAPELPEILASGARVLMVSNEHPEALERLAPDPALEGRIKAAVKRARAAGRMTVTSAAGTDLVVEMAGATTVGVWGWTDRPGTVAHWPGGVVVSFPRAGTVNGTLVLDAGDVNLTFKRYVERPIRLALRDDHIEAIEGEGADAAMMRRYLAAFCAHEGGDRAAYAVSHVGWGMNERARYEALAMYGRRDTNGTELRAAAGNFLFSTGANEFAGRFTEGLFDIPVFNCTIALDGEAVVEKGRLLI